MATRSVLAALSLFISKYGGGETFHAVYEMNGAYSWDKLNKEEKFKNAFEWDNEIQKFGDGFHKDKVVNIKWKSTSLVTPLIKRKEFTYEGIKGCAIVVVCSEDIYNIEIETLGRSPLKMQRRVFNARIHEVPRVTQGKESKCETEQ